MKTSNFLMTLLACTFLAGCSSDSKSGKSAHQPLTSQQKAELREFSQSVNDVGTAAANGNNKQRNRIHRPNTVEILSGFQDNREISLPQPRSIPRHEKLSKIEQDFESCQFTNNIDDMFGPGEPDRMINPDEILARLEQGIFFKLEGQQCPVALNFDGKLSINKQSGAVTGSFGLELNIYEKSLVELSRVNRAEIKGTVNGSGSQTGMSMVFSINGQVSHLDKGIVRIAVNGSARQSEQTANAQATITYGFADFVAVGEVSSTTNLQTGESKESYFINGEEVDAKTFMEYFAGLAEDTNPTTDSDSRNPLPDQDDIGLSLFVFPTVLSFLQN